MRRLTSTELWSKAGAEAGAGAAAVAEIEKPAKLPAAVSRNPLNSQTTRRRKTNMGE